MQSIEAGGPAPLREEREPLRHRRRSIVITLAITMIGVLLIAAGLAIAGSDGSGTAAGTVLAIGEETISLKGPSGTSVTVESVAVPGADVDIGYFAKTAISVA